MPTHPHAKSKKPHAKPHKPFAKQTKPFAKPQKSHAKPKSSIPLLTVALLQEIRALVEVNNKSKQSTEMVICQIYMESKFDKNAGGSGSSARGLMQVLKVAVSQLFQNHYEKRLGHPIWDAKELKKVHKQGEDFHDSEKMFDEATNIQYGTEYLQDRIDKYGLSKGYAMYRGVTKGRSAGIYYSKISACAVKLKINPNSLEALEEIFE